MSYIGNEPIVSATRTVTEVTATAGQTVFNANGGYTVGYLDVFLNGSKLTTTDFTATNGSSITLTEAAQVGDIVRLDAWGTFSTSNLVSPNYTGTLTGGTGVVNIGSGQVYKDASGKVGISTTSPLGKLEVKNGYSWFTAPSTDSAVIIHHDGTLGTVQSSYNSTGSYTPLTFKTSEVERMRIDSSGNVLVGTTTSTAYSNYVNNTVFRTVSSVSDSSTSSGSNIGQLAINNIDTTTNNYSKLAFTTSDGSNRVVASGIYTQVTARTSGNFVSSNMQFWTGTTGAPPAERMRIDSSGNLLVGTTSNPLNGRLNVYGRNSDNPAAMAAQPFVNGAYALGVQNASGTNVGGIIANSSSTAYNTSSDYRLKENIAPMTDALATVSALKPVTYTWKSTGEASQGFIAHELQEVVPDCVTGEKDAVDAEGNPQYQGIDTSFLVATLTAAIQEQQALIQSQADTITAMEAQLTNINLTVADATARLTALEGKQ